MIGNLQELLKGTREKGVKILYVPFHSFATGFPELKKGGPA